jgi:uncharacterized protein
LPEGFSYKIVSKTGDPMGDGLLVPGKPDGMAAFPGPDGKCILIRNHENEPAWKDLSAWGKKLERLGSMDASMLYDWGYGKDPGLGGTTTVLYDTKNQRVERQWLSLAGTHRNCAGGPTPWNSWVTCEESVLVANDLYEQDHGYCFEVPATHEPVLHAPVPLTDMGRFNHEAVAVDPKSGCVYETEDRDNGLLYRFIPNVKGQLHKGGRLQALKVRGYESADTRNWFRKLTIRPGQVLDVEWVDMENTDAPEDDMRLWGYFAKGCARFARGEGMWYGNGVIFFACTTGGNKRKGQIWKYTPSPAEATAEESNKPGKLELWVEPNDGKVIENADNLCIAPWGDVIVCEDQVEKVTLPDQYILGITPAGQVYKLGRNALTTPSELAGCTFSPDGSTLFVNIQTPGITLAITGPWNGGKHERLYPKRYREPGQPASPRWPTFG